MKEEEDVGGGWKRMEEEEDGGGRGWRRNRMEEKEDGEGGGQWMRRRTEEEEEMDGGGAGWRRRQRRRRMEEEYEGEEEMKDRQASPRKNTASATKPVCSTPEMKDQQIIYKYCPDLPRPPSIFKSARTQPYEKKQSFLTKILSPSKGKSERESPSPKKPVPLRQSARSNKGVPPDRF